jgi:EAL domain-containing protein (putative c-di-GMP-specific phosphodiesterase class I)
MADSLDLEVVAEGVETEAQLDFLTKQRCDRIQGYYFSALLAPEEMEPFLVAKNAAAM